MKHLIVILTIAFLTTYNCISKADSDDDLESLTQLSNYYQQKQDDANAQSYQYWQNQQQRYIQTAPNNRQIVCHNQSGQIICEQE